MKIFDAHAHIYPAAIAEKAVGAIGRFYGIPMTGGKGTSEDLIASGSVAGVAHYLVCSAATTPVQVRAINHFIKEECRLHEGLFSGFGTLHPDMEDPEGEVAYMMEQGLKGIKLHSDFQKFAIDDEKVFRLYEVAEGKMPILFHAGDRRYHYSNPSQIAAVAKRFPKLTIIAAHFGGYSEWEDAAEQLADLENVYFDTSSSLAFIDEEQATKMIRKAGVEKFLFGSDYPMWNHSQEVSRFCRLPLTDEEREQIFSKNLARLLSL